MTRQVSRDIAHAFRAGHRTTRTTNNTVCTGDEVYYHGSKIAWRDPETNMIWTSLCGYDTVSTKDRVNAICDALGFGRPYYTSRGNLFYDDRAIHADDHNPLCGPLGLLALGLANPRDTTHLKTSP